MADFDFLDGFDTSGDWGFTGVAEKPSDKAVSDSKQTEQVVKQTADGVGKVVSSEIVSRLESKLDNLSYQIIKNKNILIFDSKINLKNNSLLIDFLD